jgi:hypothetical protein
VIREEQKIGCVHIQDLVDYVPQLLAAEFGVRGTFVGIKQASNIKHH